MKKTVITLSAAIAVICCTLAYAASGQGNVTQFDKACVSSKIPEQKLELPANVANRLTSPAKMRKAASATADSVLNASELFKLETTALGIPACTDSCNMTIASIDGKLIICNGNGSTPYYLDGTTGASTLNNKIVLGEAVANAITSDDAGNDNSNTSGEYKTGDLLSQAPNILTLVDDASYDRTSNTLTFNEVGSFTATDENVQYYWWIGTNGFNYTFSGTVSCDSASTVEAYILYLTDEGLHIAGATKVALNEGNNYTADFSVATSNCPDKLPIVLYFGGSDSKATYTATNLKFEANDGGCLSAKPWTADNTLAGLGLNAEMGDKAYTLTCADSITTLGIYLDTEAYITGINTTSTELTLPTLVKIGDSYARLDRFGVTSGEMDWSGATSLKKLHANLGHIYANFGTSSVTDLYHDTTNSLTLYTSTGNENIYLHLPYGFARANFETGGYKRVLIGDETPDYPVSTVSSYVIAGANEGDYFGIGIVDDSYLGVVEIFSKNESVVLPTTAPWYNSDISVTRLGNERNVSNGTLCKNAPNLKSITVPAGYSNFYVSWSYNSNLRQLHMLGNVLSTYWSLNSNHTVYVNTQAYYDSYLSNNSWKSATILPEGWDFELYTVNVGRKGEFAQTYIELTDADWTLARNVKVVGALNETDLNNIKKLTNLDRLDLTEAEFDVLPNNFLSSHYKIREVYLPDSLKSISSNAFYCCYTLEKVVAPGVESIGSYAFYKCWRLKTFDTSNITSFGNYAFYDCSNFVPVISDKTTTINQSAFDGTAIKTVVVPKGIKVLGVNVFSNCKSLTKVVLPEGMTTIHNSFMDCSNLVEINIPSTVTYLSDTFRGCNSLAEIELPEGLITIGSYTFYNTALTELVIPSTVMNVGYDICSNTNSALLTTIKCKAIVPPTTTGDLVSGLDLNHCTLYVPPFTIDAYREADYWKDFYIIKALNEPVKNIYINRPMSFNLMSEDNAILQENPNMTLDYSTTYYNGSEIGQLEASGDGTLSAGVFSINHMFNARNNSSDIRTTLVNNAENMRADSVVCTINFRKNQWHFISFQYDVQVSDIEALNNTDFVIRQYDSANRAAGDGTESNWKDVPANGTLLAGKGYIIQAANNSTDSLGNTYAAVVRFPSRNTITKNRLFASTDVDVALEEYPAEFAHNRSWNLVGNPYPCYYDMTYLTEDFYTPIVLWRGSSYQAYSPIDDNIVLRPNEAFFVQRPIDVEKIAFGVDGRLNQKEAYNVSGTPGVKAPAMALDSDRSVFNFNIEGCGSDDRARIVMNENASADYELNCDASKFFAETSTGVEFYVDGAVKYAISERPFGDGSATLGARFAAEGTYTITLDGRAIDGWTVMLSDTFTGNTVNLSNDSYTFEAKSGDAAGRFVVSFVAPKPSSIDSIVAENGDVDVRVVNTLGVVVFEGSLNDFKASAEAGVYVVVEAENAYKVVVK